MNDVEIRINLNNYQLVNKFKIMDDLRTKCKNIVDWDEKEKNIILFLDENLLNFAKDYAQIFDTFQKYRKTDKSN